MQTEQPTRGDPLDGPPVIRSHVGPSDWSHSKFRVSLENLRKVSKKPSSVTMKPVGEINLYCEWVERVGDPNRTGAIDSLQEVFQVSESEAKSILSNANLWADRIKMPVYYRRMSWSTRPRRSKVEPKPEPTPDVFADARFGSLEEGLRSIKQRVEAWEDGLADARETVTERLKAYTKVTDKALDRTVGRLSFVEEHLATAEQSLDRDNDHIDQLEANVEKLLNKAKGVRKGPSYLTRLHREVLRRLRILIAGGK